MHGTSERNFYELVMLGCDTMFCEFEALRERLAPGTDHTTMREAVEEAYQRMRHLQWLQ